eukprot:7690633-Pyramimonas_sp.AAC.1
MRLSRGPNKSASLASRRVGVCQLAHRTSDAIRPKIILLIFYHDTYITSPARYDVGNGAAASGAGRLPHHVRRVAGLLCAPAARALLRGPPRVLGLLPAHVPAAALGRRHPLHAAHQPP